MARLASARRRLMAFEREQQSKVHQVIFARVFAYAIVRGIANNPLLWLLLGVEKRMKKSRGDIDGASH